MIAATQHAAHDEADRDGGDTPDEEADKNAHSRSPSRSTQVMCSASTARPQSPPTHLPRFELPHTRTANVVKNPNGLRAVTTSPNVKVMPWNWGAGSCGRRIKVAFIGGLQLENDDHQLDRDAGQLHGDGGQDSLH
jgi:hypothetical protein